MGEIAGWYKKYLSYGLSKDDVKVGLKGEFGDLLYYIAKLAELTETTPLLASKFQEVELPPTDNIDIVGMISIMTERAFNLMTTSMHSESFYQSLVENFDALLYLIDHEGWNLEDIQYANLAKLDKRHGESFKQDQANPANRDIKGEDKAIS